LTFVVALLGLILAGWLAARMEKAWRQGKEVRAIRGIEGCEVAYDGEDVFDVRIFDKPPPLPPVSWTESLLGKNFVHRAGTVGVPAARVEEALPHLTRLPYVRRVRVLQTSDCSEEQVGAAAKKIRQALPDVDTIMLAFDFNIGDKVAAREPD
jgi:hypothetical protein